MYKYVLLIVIPIISNLSFAGSISIGAGTVNSDAGALEIGQIGDEPIQPGESLSLIHSVIVSGDLFLDYSLFSYGSDLNLSSDTSFVANTITLFSYSDVPTMPSDFNAYIFSGSNLNLDAEGNWAIWGRTPISGGYFEADGNLYIGNYSNIAPVPVPPAIVLFLSGLLVPVVLRRNARKSQLAKH